MTGAILRQTQGLANLDGLIYDPFSRKLYGSSNGSGIDQIDPVTLAVTLLPNSVGYFWDGITTDSAGNLYIANYGQGRIYEYNLASNMLTPETLVFGLDDLAPLTGLGAQAPEPSSLLLLGIGVVGLAGLAWRCRMVS